MHGDRLAAVCAVRGKGAADRGASVYHQNITFTQKVREAVKAGMRDYVAANAGYHEPHGVTGQPARFRRFTRCQLRWQFKIELRQQRGRHAAALNASSSSTR